PGLELARGERCSLRVLALLLAGAAGGGGIVLFARGSAVLSAIPWLGQTPGLLAPPRPPRGVLLLGAAWTAAALLARRNRVALGALMATAAAFEAIVVAGAVAVAPLLSAKNVAAAIEKAVGRDAEIVFEAPVEYQLVAGLDFYLGRDVTLL